MIFHLHQFFFNLLGEKKKKATRVVDPYSTPNIKSLSTLTRSAKKKNNNNNSISHMLTQNFKRECTPRCKNQPDPPITSSTTRRAVHVWPPTTPQRQDCRWWVATNTVNTRTKQKLKEGKQRYLSYSTVCLTEAYATSTSRIGPHYTHTKKSLWVNASIDLCKERRRGMLKATQNCITCTH